MFIFKLETALVRLITALTLIVVSYVATAKDPLALGGGQYWLGELTSGKAYSAGETNSLAIAWRTVEGDYYIAPIMLPDSSFATAGMRVVADKVTSYPQPITLGGAQVIEAGTVLSINAQRSSEPCLESEGRFPPDARCDDSPDMLLGELNQLVISKVPDIALPLRIKDERGFETRFSQSGVLAFCNETVCMEAGSFGRDTLTHGVTPFTDESGFINIVNSQYGCLSIVVKGSARQAFPPLIVAMQLECGQ